MNSFDATVAKHIAMQAIPFKYKAGDTVEYITPWEDAEGNRIMARKRCVVHKAFCSPDDKDGQPCYYTLKELGKANIFNAVRENEITLIKEVS